MRRRISLAGDKFKGPAAVARIESHWTLHTRLWSKFRTVASHICALGAILCIEWPLRCRYWKDRRVRISSEKYGLQLVRLDCCMYGLTAERNQHRGAPMQKSWYICTNSDIVARILHKVCDKGHRHARVEGSDTKRI